MEDSMMKIQSAIQKANARCMQFENIMVSISGGADSDVMMDMLLKVCPKEKLHFVFFNTGIEYRATLRHLDYLEEKYNIKIDRQRASVPVPSGCKKYGRPFLSKFVSQMIERLQNKDFDFTNDGNKTFEELDKKYPNTKGALTWWTNSYDAQSGKKSYFNIDNNRYLKEYLMAYPPTFKISAKCCNGAKKNTSHDYEKQHSFDLKCLGLRVQEGGIRASRFKNCFEYKDGATMQNFRPIWWLTDDDKTLYIKLYDVQLSDCYTKYGMKRTGCAGCPFNSKFEEDLQVVKGNEPQLYKACNNIFGESYEYTRAYRKFKEEMKAKEKQGVVKGQISIFDIMEDEDDTKR